MKEETDRRNEKVKEGRDEKRGGIEGMTEGGRHFIKDMHVHNYAHDCSHRFMHLCNGGTAYTTRTYMYMYIIMYTCIEIYISSAPMHIMQH